MIGTFITFFLSSSINANTAIIEYKNYRIPIVTNSCNPFSAHKEKKPSVFYMNDIGFYPSDPDGVSDLPIIMGWHKAGLINLVGIGSSNASNADKNLIQTLVNLSVESQYRVPVYAKSQIPAKLIEHSKKNRCLHVAIGGSWEQLAKTIDILKSTPADLNQFVSKVSVSAVGSSNIGTIDAESPIKNTTLFTWYSKVKNTFGLNKKLVRLDRKHFAQSYPNRYSTDLNFGVLNQRSKRIAVDNWYDAHFLDKTKVGRYIRDYGNDSNNFIERNDKGGVRWLLCGNKFGSSCPKSLWGDKDYRGMKVRIADFNSVAYLIWGVDDSVVDFNDSMKNKLEEVWSKLLR